MREINRATTIRHPKRPSSVVRFRDFNLHNKVRQELGLTRGDDPTRGDMAMLTQLFAFGSGIEHLDGLEHAINLRNASFCRNSISDLSPLAHTSALTSLDLDDNKIVDVTPLAKIEGLQRLSLRHNNINDLSPLSKLKVLYSIDLDRNRGISDITQLGDFASLHDVSLADNYGLSELTPDLIKSFRAFTRIILSGNGISDISPLDALTNLNFVDLSHNKFSDVSPLTALSNLTYVRLNATKVSDVSPLATLPRLTDLLVGQTAVSDFSSLEASESLRALSVRGCHVQHMGKRRQQRPQGVGLGRCRVQGDPHFTFADRACARRTVSPERSRHLVPTKSKTLKGEPPPTRGNCAFLATMYNTLL